MKSILKKLSLFIALFTVVFGGINTVGAASVTKTVGGKKITATGMSNNGATQIKVTKGTYNLNDWGIGLKVNKKTEDGRWYNYYQDSNGYSAGFVYCLDSLKKGPGTVYAGRFLFYDQYTLEKLDPKSVIYAYDVAAMTILQTGSRNALDKSIALRSLSATFGFLLNDAAYSNTAANNYPVYQYNAFHGMAAKWKSESPEIQGYIDTIKSNTTGGSVVGATLDGYRNYYWTPISTDEALGQSMIDSAKSLYMAGMAAAAEHAQNAKEGTTKIEVDNGIVGELGSVEDVNGELVFKDVTYTIKLSGVDTKDEKQAFQFSSLTFDGGAAAYGALTEPFISEIKINGTALCQTAEGDTNGGCSSMMGQNLIKNMQDGDNTIEVKVRVQGYKSLKSPNLPVPKLKCNNNLMKFTLKYQYNLGDNLGSELEKYVGVIWRPIGDLETYQRYISYLGEATPEEGENDELIEGELKGEVVLIEECDCELLAEACEATGDVNSEDCKTFQENCEECDVLEVFCKISGEGSSYCKKYEELHCEDKPSSTNCGTQVIPITECCAGSEMVIDPAFVFTGMMSEDYEIHGVIENDIKVCFVDEVDKGNIVQDEKTNSYQMLTDDRVSNNRYCKVNCREDYAITFPTAKRVNAGRYFTFQVKIGEAKKQCFTNTIDREQYIEDVKGYLQDIKTNFNLFQYYYNAWLNAKMHDWEPKKLTECVGDACGVQEIGEVPLSDDGGESEFDYIVMKYDINPERGEIENGPEYSDGHAKIGVEATLNDVTCTGETYNYRTEKWEPCTSTSHPTYEAYPFEKWKRELEDAWKAAEEGYKTAKKGLEQAIKDFAGCSTWENEYNFNPSVTYTYEEDYAQKAGMPVDMDPNINVTDVSYLYCTQEWTNEITVKVNNTYSSCIGGSGFGGDSKEPLIYIQYCDLRGGSCITYTEHVSKTIYRKSEATATADYKPQTLFWNIYPSGEIAYSAQSDAVELTNKLPVALGTQKGVYKYNVDVTNIGEFYANGSQGRFFGSGNSVLGDMIDFTCAYLVNIPEASMVCDFDCVGPDCISNCIGDGCDDFLCEGENCVSDCVGIGCIYDKDSGTSLLQKQVSLNNMFPNGTDSYNWTNPKGVSTRGDIETKGNTVYDEAPILSITINPSVSREIRNYNKRRENEGGYSNKTVTCQDFGGYEKIACYSSFMDDLLAGTIDGVSVGNVVNDKSLINSIRHSDSYFTLWGSGVSEESMIGPSWK